jgi:hypothetical protein
VLVWLNLHCANVKVTCIVTQQDMLAFRSTIGSPEITASPQQRLLNEQQETLVKQTLQLEATQAWAAAARSCAEHDE